MPWLKPNSLCEISAPAHHVAVHSSYSTPPEMENPKSFQIIHLFVCLCHFLVFNFPQIPFPSFISLRLGGMLRIFIMLRPSSDMNENRGGDRWSMEGSAEMEGGSVNSET